MQLQIRCSQSFLGPFDDRDGHFTGWEGDEPIINVEMTFYKMTFYKMSTRLLQQVKGCYRRRVLSYDTPRLVVSCHYFCTIKTARSSGGPPGAVEHLLDISGDCHLFLSKQHQNT